MKYKSELNYSTVLIARATFRYLLKAMGWSFYAAIGISLSITIYLYVSGNRTILLGIFSGVIILGVLIFLRMFALYFSGANGEYRKLKGNRIEATIRENGISFGSSGETLRWKDLHKAWKTKGAYLFFTSKDSYVLCPTSDFEDEVSSFIEQKLREFSIPH